MTVSIAAPRADAAQLADASLARLAQVTRLLTDHPVHGEWDVRDYAILTLLISELRDVLEYYRALVTDAERRIDSSVRGLEELRSMTSSRQEPV